MSVKIITDSEVCEVQINGEASLSQLLTDNGFFLQRPCAGRGTCKKCAVLCNGESVLACQTAPRDGMVVELRGSRGEISGLVSGHFSHTESDPVTGSRECCCAAVDIGTTTVAVAVYKMPEFIQTAALCEMNRQSAYGADVISRIEHASSGGLSELESTIRSQIASMLASFGVPIEKLSVTGNTAMLHLFCGLDVKRLAVAPFVPTSLFGEWRENVYVQRCISAFVGGDTVSAVLSCGILDDGHALLADIGTNGELVLKDGSSLKCCSVAAGPAFEGAGISQGMTASDGAIYKVFTANNEVHYRTIGNKPAVGLCGSGLIDAVACMLRLGELDESGSLDAPFEIGDSGVFVTPADVRAVQLAKAAIRAGIDMLAGDCSHIERLYLAGGFGNGIDTVSCAEIGLIPYPAVQKVVPVANAALSGAAMLLKNGKLIGRCRELADSAETLQLSGNADFAQKYVDYMLF